ncbi:hypothetical protein XH94_15520 [Bradyrhizobium zhanjiangense]|uniref:Uncharacterized protein n=1 Tax=Bradyrhizobium zhanjiangense TaxID=1325107 RepID=A0A4Q0SNV0_9BRAD|nr:hypothetical protein XH94_15520 [Bradyrhizobium zhanjiangense]
MFALMSSVLLVGERMTPKLIVGGLLAMSGVATTPTSRHGIDIICPANGDHDVATPRARLIMR